MSTRILSLDEVEELAVKALLGSGTLLESAKSMGKAVRAAERSAERSDGRLVVDPSDPTRLIPPEELQKRRDAARRRMMDAGPSPGSGMPSRLRESKIKTKRLKITLKN